MTLGDALIIEMARDNRWPTMFDEAIRSQGEALPATVYATMKLVDCRRSTFSGFSLAPARKTYRSRRSIGSSWSSTSARAGDRPDDSGECAGAGGQGDQVILILLTTGTTARREVTRHPKLVGCTPVRRTSLS